MWISTELQQKSERFAIVNPTTTVLNPIPAAVVVARHPPRLVVRSPLAG